jgi:hypothetical protein
MTMLSPAPIDLGWTATCDDCIDGIHRRCRRRRHCACSECAWRANKPRPEPKERTARCGRVSTKHDYNSVDDDACNAAHLRLQEGATISQIARELNVERANLTRGLQRRGMYQGKRRSP